MKYPCAVQVRAAESVPTRVSNLLNKHDIDIDHLAVLAICASRCSSDSSNAACGAAAEAYDRQQLCCVDNAAYLLVKCRSNSLPMTEHSARFRAGLQCTQTHRFGLYIAEVVDASS